MNDLEALIRKTEAGEIKTDCPELYKHYGNPEIPDGPERQRDIWIHVKRIFDEEDVKKCRLVRTYDRQFWNRFCQ